MSSSQMERTPKRARDLKKVVQKKKKKKLKKIEVANKELQDKGFKTPTKEQTPDDN